MTYTPISAGTLNWDVPVNAAFTSQDNRITVNEATDATQNTRLTALENYNGFQPTELGALVWNFDPGMASGQSSTTAGVLHMIRLDVPVAITVTNLVVAIQTAGATLTAGQNFGALYDSSGSRLAVSADQASAFQATGTITIPLTGTLGLSPGTYHAALLTNGTTQPQFMRTVGSATLAPTINFGTTVSTARWGNSGSAQTTTPTSVTMSGRTFGASGFWAALT